MEVKPPFQSLFTRGYTDAVRVRLNFTSRGDDVSQPTHDILRAIDIADERAIARYSFRKGRALLKVPRGSVIS